MRYFASYIAALMLVITCLTPLVHARGAVEQREAVAEMLSCPDALDQGKSGTPALALSADEKLPLTDGHAPTGDADHAVRHHHSVCHGHDLAPPLKSFARTAPNARDPMLLILRDVPLTARAAEVPLRPPMA